ncbi:hypothetical protein PENSPDRAFT_86924 [Peniophora sp. CONT]|nr:hypothetical protein PENSPDRAFT_86924 [Peniophora sp. CONT]
MPVDAAHPTIGAIGTLEHVDEYRVETIVRDSSEASQNLKAILSELKRVCKACAHKNQVQPE